MNKITLESTNQTFTRYFKNKNVCMSLFRNGFDILSPIYVTPESNNRNINELNKMMNLISKADKLETFPGNIELDEVVLYSYNGTKFLFVCEYYGPNEAPDRMLMSDKPVIEFE